MKTYASADRLSGSVHLQSEIRMHVYRSIVEGDPDRALRRTQRQCGGAPLQPVGWQEALAVPPVVDQSFVEPGLLEGGEWSRPELGARRPKPRSRSG